MKYSITPILHPYANKKKLHKVNIQVIYLRMKVYVPTIVKVELNQFDNGFIVKHPNRVDLNRILKEQCHSIERRLLDAIGAGITLVKEELNKIIKGEKEKAILFVDLITDIRSNLVGKLSKGRLKHYAVMEKKINELYPSLKISEISIQWLQSLEAKLRAKGLDGNTINSNMSIIKTICHKGEEMGLIDVKQYAAYKVPKYRQKLPEYLTELEAEKIYQMLQVIEKPSYKLAGYYYLLSFYAGYRISDLKQFNYANMVNDGKIVLRAKKNGQIVSIPIHSRLKLILDYIHDKPLYLSEQKVRLYVHELAALAGINKRVTIHSGRHGFAMMLMANGFTIDEVSSMIGDTPLISKVYARIENSVLSEKVLDRLG